MSIAWSIRPESRMRGGGAHRGRGLPGEVRISERGGYFVVSWRWKEDQDWHVGSVASREDAAELRLQLRDSMARGEEPGELPTYDPHEGHGPVVAPPVSPEELAERRARLKQQLAPDAERCPRCHMLKPCDPCIPELTRETRSARRGDQ